ncbi:hypothetical protein CAEBREN_31500 [Caenorhabditis brenneri]|uniref:CCHC-type domain-containing protein n=1 Tax=Caenorhabditis brenneri TaxID=135651 RepID=G0PDV2_CAEBE|nr:hypothetical protein CAEBREN_31500 [Caenorhabditis brenneri]
MKPRSSSRIRSQIGNCRNRLQKRIDEAKDLDPVEDSKDLPTREIYQEITEVANLAEDIRTEIGRINTQEKLWQELFEEVPKEREEQQNYKLNKGDYTAEIKKANEVVKDLHKRYDALIAMHKAKSPETTEYTAFGGVQTVPIDTKIHVINTEPIYIQVPSGTDQQPRLVSAQQHVSNAPTYDPPTTAVHSTFPPTVPSSQHMPMPIHSQTPQFQQQFQQGPAPQVHQQYQQTPGMFQGTAPQMHQQHQQMPGMIPTYVPYQTPQYYTPPTYTLPALTLPNFSGKHTEYRGFMEIFQWAVHNNPTISNATRLVYLKQCLTGEAQSLVQHLPMSGDNYTVALKLLEDAYGDTIRIRVSLQSKLDNLPSVRDGNEQDIQHFVYEANSIFLQLMTIDPDSDNTTVGQQIYRKLPQRYIAKLFTGANHNKNLKASEVLELIKQYVRDDTLVVTIYNENAPPSRRSTTMSAHQSRHQPIQAPATGPIRTITTPCAFCCSETDLHRHEDCPTFKTAAERKKQAQDLKLCFKCLRTGHDIRQCDSRRQCFHCKGERHHSSLCVLKNRITRPNTGSQPRSHSPSQFNTRSHSPNQQYNRSHSPSSSTTDHIHQTASNKVLDALTTIVDNLQGEIIINATNHLQRMEVSTPVRMLVLQSLINAVSISLTHQSL